MKCWYFDKKELRETPSIKDGYPLETERRYRKEVRSFRNFPRFVTAACCLFLAGKTEETPKMCRDIVKVAQMCLPEEHFMHFGSNPCKEVLVLESIVLQTLNFELLVEHPHKFIVKYAKGFVGDQNKIQKIVQMAWNFVNDSMVTVLCVEWEPEIVAISLIHLSSKLSRYPITDWKEKKPEHKYWWDLYVGNVPLETFENICHQVLDIYQKAEPKPPPANPSNEMKRPIDPRELESGREMVLNAAGPMPQRLPGNVPGQAHWQRHESGYGPAATYGHGFPLDSRNRSGYDPRHDPRYDPRYDPKHDPRHDPRYDPKLDPRYDPKLDPRHDPRYDSRYDLKHDPRYDPKHDLKYDLKHDPRHVLMHDLRHDSGRDSRHDSKNDPGRISAYVHGRVPFHGYANEPVHLSQHGAQYLPSSRSGHNDEPIPSTSSAQDSKNHTSEETKAKVKHTARHYEQSTRKESSHYKGYMKNPYALGGNVAPIPHPSAFGYQPIQSSSWYHPFDPYYASAAPGSMLLSHGAAPPLPDYVPLSEAFVPPPPPEHTPAPPPPPPPPPPLPDCPPPPPPPPSSPTSPTSSQ